MAKRLRLIVVSRHLWERRVQPKPTIQSRNRARGEILFEWNELDGMLAVGRVLNAHESFNVFADF